MVTTDEANNRLYEQNGGRLTALWYRCNHADPSEANLVATFERDPSRPSVITSFDFVAKTSIRRGTELCFNYGEPDPDWVGARSAAESRPQLGSSQSRPGQGGRPSRSEAAAVKEPPGYEVQQTAPAGWSFEKETHSAIGRRTRRFFVSLGGVPTDGLIIAHTPQYGEDPALWKNQHSDDGALEDLEVSRVGG